MASLVAPLLAAGQVAPALRSVGEQDATKEAVPAKVADEAPSQVTGRVLFDGKAPEPKPLEISKDAAKNCCPPGENVDATDLALILSEDLGIQNVVVTVNVEGAKVEIPEEPFLMDQEGCRFLPHVLVVPKGAKVAFLNSDNTSHNVHLLPLANDPLNQTVTGGKRIEHVFKVAEPVKVKCDMHTWMTSWVVVTDATHWTLTDDNGGFSFDGLPAGEHEVAFWHETLGKAKGKVTIGEDGKATGPVEVKMAPKKKKSRTRRRRR